jgi:hypothetical protein
MGAKLKVAATALLLSFLMVEQASAGRWYCPVPEFDGSSSIAVLALLMSVGAVLFRGSKNA